MANDEKTIVLIVFSFGLALLGLATTIFASLLKSGCRNSYKTGDGYWLADTLGLLFPAHETHMKGIITCYVMGLFLITIVPAISITENVETPTKLRLLMDGLTLVSLISLLWLRVNWHLSSASKRDVAKYGTRCVVVFTFCVWNLVSNFWWLHGCSGWKQTETNWFFELYSMVLAVCVVCFLTFCFIQLAFCRILGYPWKTLVLAITATTTTTELIRTEESALLEATQESETVIVSLSADKPCEAPNLCPVCKQKQQLLVSILVSFFCQCAFYLLISLTSLMEAIYVNRNFGHYSNSTNTEGLC